MLKVVETRPRIRCFPRDIFRKVYLSQTVRVASGKKRTAWLEGTIAFEKFDLPAGLRKRGNQTELDEELARQRGYNNTWTKFFVDYVSTGVGAHVTDPNGITRGQDPFMLKAYPRLAPLDDPGLYNDALAKLKADPAAKNRAGADILSFKYGIMTGPLSCVSNMWHGMFDTTIAIWDALHRLGWEKVNPKDIALLIPVNDHHGWGKNNAGCHTLNSYPYGWRNSTWIGRMLFTLLEIDSPEEFRRRVFFMDEMSRAKQHWIETLLIDRLALGHSKLCRQFALQYPVAGDYVFPYPWPYFDAYDQHRYGPYCAALQESIAHRVLKRRQMPPTPILGKQVELLQPLQPPQRVERPTLSTDCVLIVFLKRAPSAKGFGGRTILNSNELVSKLYTQFKVKPQPPPLDGASYLENIGSKCVGAELRDPKDAVSPSAKESPVMLLEAMFEDFDVQDQWRLMQRTGVFVAARGAGTVNTMFMPYGSALIFLNVAKPAKDPAKRDQVPWNPPVTFTPNKITIVVNCDAVDDEAGLCNTLSVNFCNMRCDPKVVTGAVRFAVAAVKREKWALKRLFDGPYGAKYWVPPVHPVPRKGNPTLVDDWYDLNVTYPWD